MTVDRNAPHHQPLIAHFHAPTFNIPQGYNNSSVAAKCGHMLRDALKNEKVARRFLTSGQVWPFFDSYVHMRNFEVASDAFATLKYGPHRCRSMSVQNRVDIILMYPPTHLSHRELLLQHKKTIPNFLDREYEKFFDSYRRMLRSDNYVTKRQSLRLLEDILVDRHNFQIMWVIWLESRDVKTNFRHDGD